MPFAHVASAAYRALETYIRLRRVNVTKRELAAMLNINYTIVCSAIRGHLNRPDVEKSVSAKLGELERGAGNV